MKYLPDPDVAELSPDEVRAHFDAYRAYLASVSSLMPQAALSFALAEWHYDATRHECPHDAWVESLTVREIGSGNRTQERQMEIEIVVLGAYHDGFLRLRYRDVKAYSFSMRGAEAAARPDMRHGDWLIDEVRLSDQGSVLHEIAFSRGGRWLIDCADLSSEWEPHTRTAATKYN